MKKTVLLAMALVASGLAFGQDTGEREWLETASGVELAFALNKKNEPVLYIWMDKGMITTGDIVELFFAEEVPEFESCDYFWEETDIPVNTAKMTLTLVLGPFTQMAVESHGLDRIFIKDESFSFSDQERRSMVALAQREYAK